MKVEYTQGVCHDGAAILANGQMITIEEILQELKMCERLKDFIVCKYCNGRGAHLAENLGVSECSNCGGDGHALYGYEGTSFSEIIDYTEL